MVYTVTELGAQHSRYNQYNSVAGRRFRTNIYIKEISDIQLDLHLLSELLVQILDGTLTKSGHVRVVVHVVVDLFRGYCMTFRDPCSLTAGYIYKYPVLESLQHEKIFSAEFLGHGVPK
jgi:hypothetical protein